MCQWSTAAGIAAKVGFEPKVTDGAACANGSNLERSGHLGPCPLIIQAHAIDH